MAGGGGIAALAGSCIGAGREKDTLNAGGYKQLHIGYTMHWHTCTAAWRGALCENNEVGGGVG